MTDIAETLAAGFQHHQAGRLAEAEQLYLDVLKEMPEHADALHLLGLIARRRGDNEKAVSLIGKVVAINPGFAEAHANLANALFDLNRHDQAIAAYEAAVSLNPGLATAHSQLVALLTARGHAAAAAGQSDTARAAYERVLELKPDAADIRRALAAVTHQQDLHGATQQLCEVWRLNPDDRDAYGQFWSALQFLGGKDLYPSDAGNRQVTMLQQQQPGYVTLVGLGNALRLVRREREAERIYRQAIALEPDWPFARSRLASLLAAQHRFAEADQLFTEVASRFPGREEVIRLLPEFVRTLNRDNKALELAPGPPAGTGPNNRSVVVYAGCDGLYFEKFGQAMINSVRSNSKLDAHIHIDVVNPTPAATKLMQSMGKKDRSLSFGADTAAVPDDPEARRTWYACWRFLRLPELLNRDRKPVLMLDIDMIVLRDLNGLLETVRHHDFALVGGARTLFELWNTMWADVIVINPTGPSQHYFDLVRRYISYFLARGKARWFLDQIALYAIHHTAFISRPSAQIAYLPIDIHRTRVPLGGGQADEPDDDCLFWSIHASNPATAATLATSQFTRHSGEVGV